MNKSVSFEAREVLDADLQEKFYEKDKVAFLLLQILRELKNLETFFERQKQH